MSIEYCLISMELCRAGFPMINLICPGCQIIMSVNRYDDIYFIRCPEKCEWVLYTNLPGFALEYTTDVNYRDLPYPNNNYVDHIQVYYSETDLPEDQMLDKCAQVLQLLVFK